LKKKLRVGCGLGVEISVPKLNSQQPPHSHGIVRNLLDAHAIVVEQYWLLRNGPHRHLMRLDPILFAEDDHLEDGPAIQLATSRHASFAALEF
jgi:hypothetical protein